MEAIRNRVVLVVFLSIILSIQPNIGKANEDVMKMREEEAKKAARQAYHPHPETVISHLNQQVHRSTEGTNSIRRDLHKYNGPCLAANPIDQCWRCHKNWAKRRKKLTDCVAGFASKTTGGKFGNLYIVTDPSDNSLTNPAKGTLRHAVIQPEPLWIIFKHSMVIRLTQELMMTSNKTIDGRGVQVHIAYGAGFTLQFVSNVIIHNLHIHDIKAGYGGMVRDSIDHFGLRSRSDGDGISIFSSSNVWLDHISMSNCQDGLIDVIQGSTAVTISNCHFTHHNEALLFGASDSCSDDSIMQVTLAFNHFGKGIWQRLPRVRYGLVHVVNNDYTHWLMYAIGGSHNPTIISHGNRFIAPPNQNAKQVTKRDYATENEWKNWLWISEGDLFMNGAYFVESGNRKSSLASGPGMTSPKPGEFASRLTRFSGALNCLKGKPC